MRRGGWLAGVRGRAHHSGWQEKRGTLSDHSGEAGEGKQDEAGTTEGKPERSWEKKNTKKEGKRNKGRKDQAGGESTRTHAHTERTVSHHTEGPGAEDRSDDTGGGGGRGERGDY